MKTGTGERRRGAFEPSSSPRRAGRYCVTDSLVLMPVPGLPGPFARVFNTPVPVDGRHHLVEPVRHRQAVVPARHANNVSRNTAVDAQAA
jgi:hypothetical protein